LGTDALAVASMRLTDVVASAGRFVAAASLFGCEQAAGALAGSRPERDAIERLYTVTQCTQHRLLDGFWAVCQVGDYMQRTSIDAICDVASFGSERANLLRALACDAWTQFSQSVTTVLNPFDRDLALSQLMNSLDVFLLVKQVGANIAIPPDDVFALQPIVSSAYALGDYRAVWAIEGLGAVYADRVWETRRSAPADLLQNAGFPTVPLSSLTMLHAGIGLALARRLLRPRTPFDPPERLMEAIGDYLTLCVDNSRPGYSGAAIESLGLVTRTWHPQLVLHVDQHLRTLNPLAREFFWHGAGRALYFYPPFVVPGAVSPWRAIDREAPDEVARRNMKAGLAWAFTLVNVRQPRIIDRFARVNESLVAEDDAFAAGALSALVMALDTVPNHTYVRAFCDRSDVPAAVRALCDHVEGPLHAALVESQRLGELFRYHAFPRWFDGETDHAIIRRTLLASVTREPAVQ
jgi:hypothetical protein